MISTSDGSITNSFDDIPDINCIEVRNFTPKTTSISDLAQDHNKVFSYPNPCHDKINITIDDFEQLRLIDNKGQVILDATKGINDINISYLNSGIYYLQIIKAQEI